MPAWIAVIAAVVFLLWVAAGFLVAMVLRLPWAAGAFIGGAIGSVAAASIRRKWGL